MGSKAGLRFAAWRTPRVLVKPNFEHEKEDLKSDSERSGSYNEDVAQLFLFRAVTVFSLSFFMKFYFLKQWRFFLEIFCIQEIRPEVQIGSSSL